MGIMTTLILWVLFLLRYSPRFIIVSIFVTDWSRGFHSSRSRLLLWNSSTILRFPFDIINKVILSKSSITVDYIIVKISYSLIWSLLMRVLLISHLMMILRLISLLSWITIQIILMVVMWWALTVIWCLSVDWSLILLLNLSIAYSTSHEEMSIVVTSRRILLLLLLR